jgi:SAM-dependent methyltransferase
MTVLDLGSGAGIDVFIAAREVGPSGRSIGVDMTDAMLIRAEENRRRLGITNAEFRKGEIEHLPVESGSVDRVISNCVINLVPDKLGAFKEIHRVLRPGGRLFVSDIVSLDAVPESLRNDPALFAECISGAELKDRYLETIRDAGFHNVEILQERLYPSPGDTGLRLASVTVTAER